MGLAASYFCLQQSLCPALRDDVLCTIQTSADQRGSPALVQYFNLATILQSRPEQERATCTCVRVTW